jgi:phosphoglycolate phosphatase
VVYGLYVFDLDGTLVDSRRDIAESANEMLEACGAPALPEEVIGRLVGNGAPALVARAFAAATLEPPADALEQFLYIYNRRLLVHTRPYEGIPDVLETLRGRAPLGVLTNKPLAATRSILEGLGLARFFDGDAVVAGDGALGRKPDPSGLRYLSARASVQPRATLLVGDSFVDWQTARNASAPVCLARYGFGFEDFPVQSLGPNDHLIYKPSDLLGL